MKTENVIPVAAEEAKARQGDGLIVILQDNAQKALIIHRINAVAEEILGYTPDELNGSKIEVILGKNTSALLAEEMEFKDGEDDFGEIMSRQRDLRLKTKFGTEITVACSINRLMSEGMNACFQLVVPDEQEARAEQKIRDFISLNLEGRKQVDPVTGLPDHATAEQFLPLLKTYLAESGMQVSFAVLRLDRHAKSLARYGANGCETLLQHTAKCCISSFRSADIVFALSDHTLGLVLFDISRESARVVLNRLRWNIRSHRIAFGDKADFTITTTIGFDMIDPDKSGEILKRCEDAISAYDVDARNALLELAS